MATGFLKASDIGYKINIDHYLLLAEGWVDTSYTPFIVTAFRVHLLGFSVMDP